MKTKRSHEGYLLIHNEAPGLTPEQIASAGMDPRKVVGAGVRSGKQEYPIIRCSHCHAGVVLNPMRTRERAWCSGCDHYVCDLCAALLPGCQVLERRFERLARALVQNRQKAVAFLRRTVMGGA